MGMMILPPAVSESAIPLAYPAAMSNRSYVPIERRYLPRSVLSEAPRKRHRRPIRSTAAPAQRTLSDDAKARVRAAYEALGLKPPAEAM